MGKVIPTPQGEMGCINNDKLSCHCELGRENWTYEGLERTKNWLKWVLSFLQLQLPSDWTSSWKQWTQWNGMKGLRHVVGPRCYLLSQTLIVN